MTLFTKPSFRPEPPRKLKKYRVKALSRKVPALRLYEQLIIYGLVVIFIPLLLASVLIFTINQKALQKELTRFTEDTAHIIYTDLLSQLSAQEEQSRMIARVAVEGHFSDKAMQSVFYLSRAYTGVGVYEASGHRIQQYQRPTNEKSPALPLAMPLTLRLLSQQEPFSPVFLLQRVGAPASANEAYYLLAFQPLEGSRSGAKGPQWIVIQKRFDALKTLVDKQNEKLNKGFYMVDADGAVIAGPSISLPSTLTNLQDELEGLLPGVTWVAKPSRSYGFWGSVFANSVGRWWPFNTLLDSDDDAPTVERVLMKLPPPTSWGLVLESPYEVRQKFIKRARNQTLLLILGHLLLVSAFTAVYVSGIRRNFRQLIKGIQAMAEGRYSRRIRLLTNWFTPFEIVYLTGEFNRMSRRRESVWQSRETLTDELQVANQQLAQLDAMKSNLMDTVSHELRTPLTSIKGYTARLIRYHETLDPATRLKSLKVIRRQADRLNRMVDDLLAIPELEQNHLRVQLEPVALQPVLDRALQLVQQSPDGDASASHKVITVTYEPRFESLGDLVIEADPDRLEQVLVNVLENAIKYGLENEPIAVTVQGAQSASSANPIPLNECLVMVANSCSPEHMPASDEEAASLFEKFKRLDDSSTRTTRGTGLGLFITRGLMEAMGGSVSAQVINQRFVITLRFKQTQILPL
ncbi:MAG: histidine kinase dimerization/phospho-acceptor domain-containing protein [Vampirovibrionales bacterium]|nr:histidine kinase dimerization/phospho-acceptor domain-containing protein [Vampirovibrionales bacterium]